MATTTHDTLDWSLVQAFLAVAETGSLSAAALQLGLSQPTLGRQIKTIETSLDQSLFIRHSRGLSLSDDGGLLYDVAKDMATSAAKLRLLAAGQSEKLAGVVRITASTVVSHFILPSILAHLRHQEPDIQIELNPSDSTENLLFKEADIAVRMYRPEQLDVITQYVGDSHLGLFAEKSYLERKGYPTDPEDLIHHDLVGYDRSDRIIRGMREFGLDVDRSSFAVRCDDQAAYWQLVCAGCGIGAGSLHAATSVPALVRILPQIPIEPLPFWLTAHPALRSTPRIRRVWNALAEGLKAVSSVA
jgi:DNA-binding transcriptional LysR family regulator